MSKRNIVLIFAMVVLFVVAFMGISLFHKHKIDCHLIFSYVNSSKFHGTWNIVSDTGFYTGAMFAKDYKLQTGKELPEQINLNKNTYVICYGYKLKELYYRENAKSGRFTSDRPYYYANAILEKASDGEAHIYLVDAQMLIDRDPHSNTGDDTIIIEHE